MPLFFRMKWLLTTPVSGGIPPTNFGRLRIGNVLDDRGYLFQGFEGFPIRIAHILRCGVSDGVCADFVDCAEPGEVSLGLPKGYPVCPPGFIGSCFHLYVMFPKTDFTNVKGTCDGFVAAARAGKQLRFAHRILVNIAPSISAEISRRIGWPGALHDRFPIRIAFVLCRGSPNVFCALLGARAEPREIPLGFAEAYAIGAALFVGAFFHHRVMLPAANITNVKTLRNRLIATARAGKQLCFAHWISVNIGVRCYPVRSNGCEKQLALRSRHCLDYIRGAECQ
jgi:hypothetical protein